MAIRNEMDAAMAEENASPQPIGVLGSSTATVKEESSAMGDHQDHDENSNDSTDAAVATKKAPLDAMMMPQETPDAYKATDKAFRLLDITEAIPRDDRANAILSIINEIISNDGSVLNAAGEFLYHKCLIRFAVKIGLDSLRESMCEISSLNQAVFFMNSKKEAFDGRGILHCMFCCTNAIDWLIKCLIDSSYISSTD